MDTFADAIVPARTAAQSIASRTNGSQSTGPLTAIGKELSSANSLKHGITATSTLLPSERPEDYQSCIDGWAETLRPSSPGEAHIVARIGDLNYRLRRVQAQEDRHLAAALESKIAASPVAKMLQSARDARLGLASLIDNTSATTCSGEELTRLLTPIRAMMRWLGGLDLAPSVTVPLAAIYEELSTQAALDLVEAEVFQQLAVVVANVIGALDAMVTGLERDLEAAREQIASETTLGDDPQLKKLGRYRTMLDKHLDAELGRLKIVRELAQGSTSGSFCMAISVELKVLGRAG